MADARKPDDTRVSDQSRPGQEPVPVPHTALEPATLQAVIESFVLREGTDYGVRTFTLSEKVAHVHRQLERGEAQILFDPASGSIDIVRVTAPPRRG